MNHSISYRLTFARKLLPAAAGMPAVAVIVIWILISPQARAQAKTEAPAFEVASIKPAPHYLGGPLRVNSAIEPNGINFRNVTLRMCIARAYGVKPYQVTGPAWINEERYFITAKAAGPAKEDVLMLMLRTLLADRFKLAFHRESKEMPVYALVVAKNGHKMKESNAEGETEISGGDGPGIVAASASIDQLTAVLRRHVDLPVLNETGLKGRYNFKLMWSQEEPRSTPAVAGEVPVQADPSGAPSIFTAVQEQLGLKLEARRALVEVIVMDRAEKVPIEN